MNKTLLYIHGFASAGSSGTAVQMRTHLYPKGVIVESPDIPVDPIEAMLFLRQKVQDVQPSLIVATSMGALYAEQLRGVPRILVNPSFQMARLLMMRGMGRQQFRNKRMDGSKDFKVDKAMIEAFRQVEKHSFEAITPQEKELVWGLFGLQDKNVNCQGIFRQHYGEGHFVTFQGEHYLNGQVLGHTVLPLVEQLLSLQQPVPEWERHSY